MTAMYEDRGESKGKGGGWLVGFFSVSGKPTQNRKEKNTENVPFIPDPIFDKSEIVMVQTIYDLAHAAGLKTSGIVWPSKGTSIALRIALRAPSAAIR